jgi:hypothetical protein
VSEITAERCEELAETLMLLADCDDTSTDQECATILRGHAKAIRECERVIDHYGDSDDEHQSLYAETHKAILAILIGAT